MPDQAVMHVTGAAALHVLLMRVSQAQDAYEVFGWTADTVFTFAEMQARTTEFQEVMAYDQDPVWCRQPQAVRKAFQAVVVGAYNRWMWAMGIVAAKERVMDDQSGGETHAEA